MILRFFKTIAFRLTVWYAGVFSVSSCVVFILFYFLATQVIVNQMDQELLDKSGIFSTIIQRKGMAGANNLAVLEAQAAGEKKVFFRLLYPNGEVFATSHMGYWGNIQVHQPSLEALIRLKEHVFLTQTVKHDARPLKSSKARVLYDFVAPDVILQTGLSMDTYESFLAAYKRIFGLAMGFVVVFSALLGWFMSKKALSGVDTITTTVKKITGSTLDERVFETGNQDELDYLAKTFNQMLDRIQILIKSIQEMSDNIAHDLKSPITRIRGFAELSLVQQDTLDDYRAMAANTIEESDRLLDMINTMLVISKVDAGQEEFNFELIDLSAMILDACELYQPLAEERQLDFTFDIQDQAIVSGDRRMLQRAFSNLVDNAFKYTRPNDSVSVRLLNDVSKLTVEISDTGIGIDPLDLEKIFQRFYRADESRTKQGAGLGLSLARTIARAHSGDITVTSQKGENTCFSFVLPHGNSPVI
ncbi:MAG: HAMP domain-containing protein [Desulfobacteraceae bacterium]|nr:MAG: HAMP domain-containing protein [Desulfobacteraceae bacterium]